MSNFIALDFETADYSRNSACALGLVWVRDGQIVQEAAFLLRPPQRRFVFTYIHGLTWQDVQDAPTFEDLWPTIEDFLHRADFLVAHNAGFDRSVLRRCCEHYGLALTEQPFHCTVKVARQQWNLYPTNLPTVCDYLGIALKHHDAASDARACAQILLAAQREGWCAEL